MINIIIPVLNEEKILRERHVYYQALAQKAGVVFVDGGSTDGTLEAARACGQVVMSGRGRGPQKDDGARAAGPSPFLWFLHVDTIVDAQAMEAVERALASGAEAGCLTLKIGDPRRIFRVFEWAVNVRARRFGVIDGDLGMFIRRDVFEALGGFGPHTVMEDIIFSKKVAKQYTITVLPEAIHVSSRKWDEKGFGRTLGRYAYAYGRFYMAQAGLLHLEG